VVQGEGLSSSLNMVKKIKGRYLLNLFHEWWREDEVELWRD
jgi:hypothetical protein